MQHAVLNKGEHDIYPQILRMAFERKVVDLEQLLFDIVLLCNMRLKQHSQVLMDDFMEAIQGIEEITECYNTSGEYDFTLKIQTRDMESYQEFMRTTLGNIESVGYFHSIFVMKEVKNTHGVPVKSYR